MHVTWLVENPETFFRRPGRDSGRDRSLGFGLNYREWLALYFDVLGVDRSSFDRRAAEDPSQERMLGGFEGEVAGYPMLSRISGVFRDAVFAGGEVEALQQECLRVKAGTSHPVALKGIDKLLGICGWARCLGLSIYLLCD